MACSFECCCDECTDKTEHHGERDDEGLLPEPPRSSNGYKHYGVRQLIQLMHIRRLVDLGVPLAEIPSLDPSTDSCREVLEALASETTAEIERLVVVRDEIAQLLEEPGTWEMSSGTTGSTDGDFLTVLSRVLDEDSLRAWRRVERRSPTPRSWPISRPCPKRRRPRSARTSPCGWRTRSAKTSPSLLNCRISGSARAPRAAWVTQRRRVPG